MDQVLEFLNNSVFDLNLINEEFFFDALANGFIVVVKKSLLKEVIHR